MTVDNTKKASSKDAHAPHTESHSDRKEDDETTSTYKKDTHKSK